ncbi:hypothetical protein RFI_21996 [Reticulomyxa filosa]|uniref:Uncharacterized protein n=1 Tax=Reticulomyxa filosa TaxID=46433 RepID=X6MN29_RETFI|nr:hypothetical protein RFI_21996 [Reticulomyxa filosa]|eukprot:ETO15368.1 hypothetical protein RFI_21996 [Reticulomyxa filosa]
MIEAMPYLKNEAIVKYFLQSEETTIAATDEKMESQSTWRFASAKKKWDASHMRPSFSQQYDNLREQFPDVAAATVPLDISLQYSMSKRAVKAIIQHLEEVEKVECYKAALLGIFLLDLFCYMYLFFY